MPQETFEAEVFAVAKGLATFENEELLKIAIGEIVDRVSLFLNLPEEDANFDRRLVRILASMACGNFSKFENLQSKTAEQAISSLSDNGQSISYANAARNYFTTAADSEIFDGYVEILKPFRRLRVVA